MPLDNKPVGTTKSSMERISRVCDRVEGRVTSGVGQRRRRMIPGSDGGGSAAAIAGGVAVASEDISESTETTWAALPQSVKDQVPNGGTIANDAQCWQLSSGDGTAYQLVAELDGQGGIATIYMVPVASDDTRLYNMAGAVDKDRPLQVKTLTVRIGGVPTPISIIDVEKC